MECARFENGIFGIGETNFPDWSWMVATPVTDIPVWLASRQTLV